MPRSRASLDRHSVVVDAALNAGRIQIAEHLKRGGGLRLLGMALLEGLQFSELLFDLAGDGLIPPGLSLGQL